ncbi:hypothetical protein [Brevundimonas sp.]|uniref:hypothetical protein n=1 Tax=Brevundimonas sp. TaxID=1871086 RepID=UPI002737E88B|nr:hypothetical protein [Brevundimonas sp.]MDP3803173.1 hypothetical protein [Brevundimonas sp.]
MNRIRTCLLAALIAAAPLSAAAQDRGDRGDRDRGGDRSEQIRPAQRQISVSEAQGIARSRARGATFVGFVGTRGDQYVFRFDRDGQLFDVAVSMTGR